MTKNQENKIREEWTQREIRRERANNFQCLTCGSPQLHDNRFTHQFEIPKAEDCLSDEDWWLTKIKEQIEIAVREREEEISKIISASTEEIDFGSPFAESEKQTIDKIVARILSTSPKE